MEPFEYRGGTLVCDGMPAPELAEEFGTPLYVYSEAGLRTQVRRFRDAFGEVDPLICYAIKANYNLAVCEVFRDEGCGFDIVSGGELFRVRKIGGDPARVVFAGVGKSRAEIEDALDAGILLFNTESEPELRRIDQVAGEKGKIAPVSLRLNPDVDPHTHEHMTTGTRETKFGIDLATAPRFLATVSELQNVRLIGLHVHIGSQIESPEPYGSALDRLATFFETCRDADVDIEWLDVGGGFGIDYRGGETAAPADYADAIIPRVKRTGCRAILEPGRFLVGNSAILLTRVQYVKKQSGKTFVICDAGMNDLIRPALYGAYHRIWPAVADEPAPEQEEPARKAEGDGRVRVDVVGPVCETADVFACDRALPPVSAGDLLAIFSAGAYSFSMSSNYNSRPRACEVMMCSGSPRIVRQRESYEDLIVNEII
ncbi:MAG: diaminopimelate decarboxylase [Planctomycetota bacterium]